MSYAFNDDKSKCNITIEKVYLPKNVTIEPEKSTSVTFPVEGLFALRGITFGVDNYGSGALSGSAHIQQIRIEDDPDVTTRGVSVKVYNSQTTSSLRLDKNYSYVEILKFS